MKLGITTTDDIPRLKIKTTDDITKAVACACCIPFSLFIESKSGRANADYGASFSGFRDLSTHYSTLTKIISKSDESFDFEVWDQNGEIQCAPHTATSKYKVNGSSSCSETNLYDQNGYFNASYGAPSPAEILGQSTSCLDGECYTTAIAQPASGPTPPFNADEILTNTSYKYSYSHDHKEPPDWRCGSAPGGDYGRRHKLDTSTSITLSNPITPQTLKSRVISNWTNMVKEWQSIRDYFEEYIAHGGYSYENFVYEWGSGDAYFSTVGINCRNEAVDAYTGRTHDGYTYTQISGAESYRLSFTNPPTNYLKVWLGIRTDEACDLSCTAGHWDPISDSFSEISILLANPSNYTRQTGVQYSEVFPFGQDLIGNIYNRSCSAYRKFTHIIITRYSFVEGYEPDISDPMNKQPNGFPDPNWEPSPP